jgi:hypothetical protein
LAKAPGKLPETGRSLEELIDDLMQERPFGNFRFSSYGHDLTKTKTGPKLLAFDRERQVEIVRILVDRVDDHESRLVELRRDVNDPTIAIYNSQRWLDLAIPGELAVLALKSLLRRKLPLDDTTVVKLIGMLGELNYLQQHWFPLISFLPAIENRAAQGPLDDTLSRAIESTIARLKTKADPDEQKLGFRLLKLVHAAPTARIEPGEAWSDAAIEDLASMGEDQRGRWSTLLVSCQEAGKGKPSDRWLKQVRPLLGAIGFDDFKRHILRWFPLVDRPRTQSNPEPNTWEQYQAELIEPDHIALLKGLAWCSGFEADRELARALTALALSAYRKIPGRGPRLIALGHSAIAGLGSMPGMDAVGQLALLKVKIKFLPAQKEVEKALSTAAEREGLPREEIEELAVPTYGMEAVGHRREILGDYAVEIVVEGQDARLAWSKVADGKPIKSIPAAVKKEHANNLKDLQSAVKDVGKMLTAQRERIDSLFLAKKSWSLDAWRERYLDHPLVGTIARRLIWRFKTEHRTFDGCWLDDRIVGSDDRPIDGLNAETKVDLWHPIDRSIEDVTAWRDWLDRQRIRQPFKQAHREVYVLTDAERNTRIYSNRFAAHILRQHQYHALCAARGWRNKLRLMVDASYPPTSRDLPEWGLRAEFWVEGIGDNYGTDTTESGSYLYLSTDQVRFYEIGSAQRQAQAGGGGYAPVWNQVDDEPVPIQRIPPLVLSEVLRDVDLFVGVASLGNDPAWSDGGPDGRHVDYWNAYSFGNLSANGQTRKVVLERLIPRLKIASRCSFTDKFLVVKGDLRIYKIHLGSGNILMEPNDQYLCIVPRQTRVEPTGQGVFLPFEGDNTLSIILSKAMMLAEDKKISDPTITSQIHR